MVDKVTPIERPKCSRCGAYKPESELNGYNPFASIGQKYASAYCARLVDCKSKEAAEIIEELNEHLNPE